MFPLGGTLAIFSFPGTLVAQISNSSGGLFSTNSVLSMAKSSEGSAILIFVLFPFLGFKQQFRLKRARSKLGTKADKH